MNDPISPKILIVDDMETNIDILVGALREDYRVGMAMNGQGAIESAKRSRPDLILLDIMMPGINGFEVCQNLKQNPFTRKIPIIFITALDASEHKTRGFEVGAVDYITKPFDITEVKARVKTHLALKTAREALKNRNRMLEENIKSERVKSEELTHLNNRLESEIKVRQLAEKKLAQSLKATKLILESMPFGVVIVGKDKKIRMLNHASLKMMGVDSSDGIINNICHNRICPALENECPILDLGQKVDSSEKILLGPKDKRIPILKTVVPINIEDEEVLLEAFVDISYLKQMEADLQISKEQAESANRIKSDFLANMSHELRTPLNHIIGFTEIILERYFGDINKTQEDHLVDVLSSSKHLLSLINDILDLSKVEAGKMELTPTPVDLKTLLEKSLNMIKEKAMKHGIQLSTEINGIQETITADERKLKQIVFNLLSNAAKFTPDGGKVTISVERCVLDEKDVSSEIHSQNSGVKISISDTGIGINSKDLDRIFKPFEQSEASRNRKFQGTGLGLSLTKQFVKLHGGRIWAESEGEGKGCTFHFVIPI